MIGKIHSFLRNHPQVLIATVVVAVSTFYFFVYWPVLSIRITWDDQLLLNDKALVQPGSPWIFWTRGHEFTKAWPIYYTIVWFFQALKLSPAVLHFINVVVHYCVGWAAFLLFRRLGWKGSWLVAPLIWFHPIFVEAVAWINQLSKLLGGLLILSWLYFLLSPDSWRTTLLRWAAIVLAVLTCGYGYLLSAAELSNVRGMSWKRATTMAMLFLFVAYSCFLVAAGTNTALPEASFSQRYFRPLRSERVLRSEQEAKDEHAYFRANIFPEVWSNSTHSAIVYLHSTFFSILPGERLSQLEFWRGKLTVVGYSALFYSRMFVFPVGNKVIYNFTSPDALRSFWHAALGGIVLLSVPLTIFFRWHLTAAILLTFLPVSGLFYVPFMKFTLVADRLIYVPCLIAIIALAKKAGAGPLWLRSVAWCWLLFLMVRITLYTPEFLEATRLPFWHIQGY